MMSFVVYYIYMHYLYIQHYRGLSLARCQRKCYTDVCHTVVNIRNVGHSLDIQNVRELQYRVGL